MKKCFHDGKYTKSVYLGVQNMKLLLELPYFTLMMVMQIRGISVHNARVWLSRQSKAQKILRLTRGIYMGRDYYNQHKNDPNLVGMIASIVQPHSYLSGEWVLQKYGVMTEGIFNITSVTAKHTREIVNPIGRFVYSHVALPIFDGYSDHEIDGVMVREASPAKALYDYFYLRKTPEGIGDANYSITEDLRLNLDHLGPEVQREFGGWVKKYSSPKMITINNNLRRSGWGL